MGVKKKGWSSKVLKCSSAGVDLLPPADLASVEGRVRI